MQKNEKSNLILITGTTSGIGKVFQEYFLSKNYQLISVNRLRSKLPKIDNYQNFNIDIKNLKEVFRFITYLKNKKKIPNIFVLNAGVNIYDNIRYFDLIKFKNCFDVNFFGAMNFVHAIEKLAIKNRKIIFMSSTSGIVPNPASLGYYSSKLLIYKLTHYLNLNNNNCYKALILGPILTRISRNLIKPRGLAKIIYNFLSIKPEFLIKKFEEFIMNKKEFLYYTKMSIVVYYVIKFFLIFFPKLYKGGKNN
jgi:short-subunit dehydrogenase